MAGRQISVKTRALTSMSIFVAIVLAGLTMSYVIQKHVHSAFWWLGFVLVLAIVTTLKVDLFEPYRKWRLLGKERIQLNLEAQLLLQNRHKSRHGESTLLLRSITASPVTPLGLRTLPLLCLLGIIFLPGLTYELKRWSNKVLVALEPARLSIEVEPPSYSSLPPTEAYLPKGHNLSLTVTAGSYLKLRKTGGKGLQALFGEPATLEQSQAKRHESNAGEKVSLLIVTEAKSSEKNSDNNTYRSPFSNAQSWSGSTGLLTDALKLDSGETSKLQLKVFLENFADDTPSNAPDFLIDLQIDPTPIPTVKLALSKMSQASSRIAEQEALSSDETDQNRLTFAVSAESQIPLTQVELVVRTESGYKFNMPVGEFAGTDRLSFSSEDVKLQTVGIPFTDNDTLYVKARAQTVVRDLAGVSQELSFKVKSPQQTRKALIAQLEKILEQVQAGPKNTAEKFPEFKNDLASKLAESVKTAQELGKQSAPARNLESARRLATELPNQGASQTQLEKIESKVKDTLETLKRRQAQDQASSWFLKTKAYLDKLSRAETIAPEFVSEAQSLQSESEKLKDGIAQLLDSPNSGLKLEEKQLGMNLLAKDKTPERMQKLTEQLDQGKKETAVNEGQATLSDAAQGLGAVLQLINVARARQIKEAKEKLSKADENLENTRQNPQKQQQEQTASQAQKELDSTPQLGDSFNKALAEAKEGAARVRQAIKQAPSASPPTLLQELDKTQQAIAEALAALQDEEQASREERGEDEGRRFRSALDALNAQGQLDSGWRKKIFEEISRLREKGVPADADIIRYLESRLR